MLKDVGALREAKGFSVAPHVGSPGHYVIERAFVER
jgi:ferredoxin--NADP+ reductase